MFQFEANASYRSKVQTTPLCSKDRPQKAKTQRPRYQTFYTSKKYLVLSSFTHLQGFRTTVAHIKADLKITWMVVQSVRTGTVLSCNNVI